jgi:hypothetical protein
MKGIFELRTAADLFRKLEYDFNVLSAAPTDCHAAYNFFVTAWHLLDWLYLADKAKHDTIRDSNPILQVCEHLAVGAKHFVPANRRLKSVMETGRARYWPKGYWHPHYWAKWYWRDSLVVELGESVRETFDPQMDVLPLAQRAIDFWRTYDDLRQSAT